MNETKVCKCCRQTQPVTAFGPCQHLRDGLNTRCRACANAEARAAYARRIASAPGCADKVPPELLAEIPGGKRLTCLQCRHCQLLPETNFSPGRGSRLIIFCGKENGRMPVMFNGCPLADPRPAQPRALRKYWIKYGPLGDRVSKATPALLAYLQACWTRERAAVMEKRTGRTMNELSQIARSHGIGGVAIGQHRLGYSGAAARTRWTPQQEAYLQRAEADPSWPAVIGRHLRPETRAVREAQRAAILQELNRLGPPRTWQQTVNHLSHRRFRENQRRAARRAGGNQGRRVNQFVTLPLEAEQNAAAAKPKPIGAYATRMRARQF